MYLNHHIFQDIGHGAMVLTCTPTLSMKGTKCNHHHVKGQKHKASE